MSKHRPALAHRLPRGVLRVPAGTCPGCGKASHPGFTCGGLTTEQVLHALRRIPGVVEVES